jgi:hypothetical protein
MPIPAIIAPASAKTLAHIREVFGDLDMAAIV